MDGFFAAVVTGDVNAASRMSAGDARSLGAMLEQCFDETRTALPEAGLDGMSVYRGDSWQFAVRRAELSVRATIFFRCCLLVHSDRAFRRRLHTAAAIGLGTIDYLPGPAAYSAGGGRTFEHSGKRLDRLRRRVPGMGLAGAGEIDSCLDHLLGLIDALMRRWTASQARAVALALQGLSQTEIAVRWNPPISQQAIHKHLAASGWPALEPALNWAQTTIEGC